MKTKAELLDKISEFKRIKSKTGKASYSNFVISGDTVRFVRDNTQERWQLNINEVYDVYKKERFINTTILRKHMQGRVYSPSLAILIAAEFCDEHGNRMV